jgi:ribose 5-phosphate isomerase B
MRIHIASDHAGFELKQYLVTQLQSAGYDVEDHGAERYLEQDDYPPYCVACAQAVAEEGSLGIVLGGSGNGEQIAANKVPGIRAILVTNNDLAKLGREHNNANIISLGGRFTSNDDAWTWVQTFINTPFSGETRHQRRIDQIARFEEFGEV